MKSFPNLVHYHSPFAFQSLCALFIQFSMCLLLQTQALRVEQEKEPCIRVNTRELNRELCTRWSTLYTNI